jgi:DNA-binding transcriptional regulator YiaG
MKSPYTGGRVETIKDRVKIKFKEEEFEVDITNYKCVDTGNIFGSPQMIDDVNILVQNLWRKKHKVPTIDELTRLRKKIGLNKKEMSALLNLGINQYRYYEKGEIPKGPALLLLQIATGSDYGLQHIMATQNKILPNKSINALDNFLCGAVGEINVNNNPVVVENTPRVNKKVSPYASFVAEEDNFQEYPVAKENFRSINHPAIF